MRYCSRQNSINTFARAVFSIFILSIFSIILALSFPYQFVVMQNIFTVTKLPDFHVHSHKYYLGEHVMKYM